MRASKGAIEDFSMDQVTYEPMIMTIGNVRPKKSLMHYYFSPGCEKGGWLPIRKEGTKSRNASLCSYTLCEVDPILL